MVIEVNYIKKRSPFSATSLTPFLADLYSKAETSIKRWEHDSGKKLTSTIWNTALESFRIHRTENRGITRPDVQALGYTENYASTLIQECQSIKLLVPLDGYKQGRFKQYFLATEMKQFLKRQADVTRKRQSKTRPSAPELNVIQIIINEITRRKPKFHKYMIHIPAPSNGAANFKTAYDHLVKEEGWNIKSQNNKAKVKTLKLDDNRSASIQVYPRGKIIIGIGCSLRSFDLSHSDDSREFFETLGIIQYCLALDLTPLYNLHPTGEWRLKQYDREVTLVCSDLERKYPHIKNWYSKEGIKIGALGHVFQIYGKIIPVCGKCLRLEDNVTLKGDMPIELAIKEAVNRPFQIISLLESFSKKKKVQKGFPG